MGKLKALIPVTMALAIAVAGSMFIYNWMDRQSAPPQVLHQEEQVKVVPVVVAAADLTWGTVLKKEMLRTASYLRSSLPEGYYTEPVELVGRVTHCRYEQQ